ncbi:MAG: hypothetical protein SF051_04885 [Elusimicrobiota bacterium]|nr:hypothetical protein [Elusimicrobiota bacterium]
MTKVLLVEDDPGMRFVMSETLREAGLEPVVAGVERAPALAAELPAALIVASLTTAAYDNEPLYKALRADPRTKDIRLLLCTGRGEGTIRRSLGERPPFVLFKPFTVEQFAAAVKAALTAP